jgi:glycosyltransferase involved in cell wall biosynthesis
VKRLLLLSQLPIDRVGGATLRWRYFLDVLPGLGWEVDVISQPGAGSMSGAVNTGSDGARRALFRAARTVRHRTTPLFERVGVLPEAFLPGPAWALAARRQVDEAIAAHRPDAIWATCPPAAGMFPAARAAHRHRIPMVLEFRDLWAGNPGNDAGRPLLGRIQHRAARHADRIVTMTDEARARLAEVHPDLADRLVVLPNGFRPDLIARRVDRGAEGNGKPVLIHAGQLYGQRSIDGLVAALARPELARRTRLLLIGAVNERSQAALDAAGDAVDVEVRPPTTWDEAIDATARADVAVVLFTPGDATAVPGKLYEALALGVPVLALTSGDSALARLLERLGRTDGIAPHDDPAAIAAELERVLASPPAPLPAERLAPYDRSRVAGELARMLDDLVAAT